MINYVCVTEKKEEAGILEMAPDEQGFSHYGLVVKCIKAIKTNFGVEAHLESVFIQPTESNSSPELGPFLRADKHKTSVTLEKPSHYNFGEVVPGLLYRSRQLGRKGLEWLEVWLKENQKPRIRSVASIHVYGYGGGKFKHRFASIFRPEYFNLSYNLEEFHFAEERGLVFLHSYSPEPKTRVYFDGEDPSFIPRDDPSHGDIYRPETIDLYLSSQAVETLKINLNHPPVEGHTGDFLNSLINIIEAPWPLLFHCKGGKHKTGMLAMLLQYFYLENTRWNFVWDQKNFEKSAIFDSYHRFNSQDPEERNLNFIKNILNGTLLRNDDDTRALWEVAGKKFAKKFQEMREWLVGEEARFFLDSVL